MNVWDTQLDHLRPSVVRLQNSKNLLEINRPLIPRDPCMEISNQRNCGNTKPGMDDIGASVIEVRHTLGDIRDNKLCIVRNISGLNRGQIKSIHISGREFFCNFNYPFTCTAAHVDYHISETYGNGKLIWVARFLKGTLTFPPKSADMQDCNSSNRCCSLSSFGNGYGLL